MIAFHMRMHESMVLTWLLLLLFTTLPLFHCQQQQPCERQSYNCGLLTNISYPFWGKDRSQNCGGGDPFYLSCDGDYPTLRMGLQNFLVLEIDTNAHVIRMERADIASNFCSPQREEISLDSGHFRYRPSVHNITMFYDCPASGNYSSGHVITIFCGNKILVYYVGVKDELVRKHPQLQSCNRGLQVPAEASLKLEFGTYEALKGVLGYGFRVDYTVSELKAVDEDKKDRRKLLVIILSITTTVILILGVTSYYQRKRIFQSIGMVNAAKDSPSLVNKEAAGPFDGDAPNLHAYRFSDIEEATDTFSHQNKLGQGGYGPVYKGILPDGQEIAVKKLSKISKQGSEEFKNEVTLIARLQHVNLVRLLGFCVEREEHMLVYEYMANKSLDFYLFDPARQHMLDWSTRVDIIEGVTQGLLYLQEYSRLTIIHRDLKAGNILLDSQMKPKISDFGMARIFSKDEQEASSSTLVGTYGYLPPESLRSGVYSTKSDVYSFGVLLLQIISGKKTTAFYGENDDLMLFEYAYELWEDGKGMEFMDHALDDTSSPCKMMRCMQIALLCIQEHADDRPSMLEVYSMLRSDNNSLAIPRKPAFSRARNEEAANVCQPLEIISVDDATITEVVCR